MPSKWYKDEPDHLIWWKDEPDRIGEFVFSFDKKHEYNLFEDYHKLTPEQREIFDRENKALADLFAH